MFAHQLRCEAGPGGEKSGVNGLGPGMHYCSESTSVEVLDQICLGAHLVCAAGEGVKCLGGNRWGLREIYVIESSSGVSLTSDVGAGIAQLDLAVVEHISEVAVAELAY